MIDSRQNERLRLLSELRVKRQQQCWDDGDIVLIPRLSILANYPYVKKKTHSVHLVPSGRTVLDRIEFRARCGCLPFGHDRSLGDMILGDSFREGPFVPLNKPRDYFDRVGIKLNGKNRRDLVERFMRLKKWEIIVNGVVYHPIGSSHLPQTIDPDSSGPLNGVYGVLLDEPFFRLLHEWKAVPVPAEFLRAVKDPQLQHFCLFLYWRSVAAKTVSCIGWDLLRRQFPQDDGVKSRMWRAMDDACNIWRAIWPEFDCEANETQLIIRPSRKPFLAHLSSHRSAPVAVEDTVVWKRYVERYLDVMPRVPGCSEKRTSMKGMGTTMSR